MANVTTFVDDYKLRGRMPAENIGPRVFLTEELAEKWVAEALFYFFKDEEWDEECISEIEGLTKRDFFYHEKLDVYTPHRNRKNDYDYMTSIAGYMREGGFVPCTITWDISKHTVVEGEAKRRKRSKSQ